MNRQQLNGAKDLSAPAAASAVENHALTRQKADEQLLITLRGQAYLIK